MPRSGGHTNEKNLGRRRTAVSVMGITKTHTNTLRMSCWGEKDKWYIPLTPSHYTHNHCSSLSSNES